LTPKNLDEANPVRPASADKPIDGANPDRPANLDRPDGSHEHINEANRASTSDQHRQLYSNIPTAGIPNAVKQNGSFQNQRQHNVPPSMRLLSRHCEKEPRGARLA